MATNRTVAPVAEPISLDEAKAHLRVTHNLEDALIAALIKAAREWAEGYQNRAYITQTWELWLDEFPRADYIPIPQPPLKSVTSVKYYDTANTEATMAATDYFVDAKSEPGRLVLAYGSSWPSTTLRPANGVCITFVAGYGDAADIPQAQKAAMLLAIGTWYSKRETIEIGSAVHEVPFAAKMLLDQARMVPV